ncbi:MAG: flagellar basal body L-ring protein [Micavibrio sp.]|nr:flagellar basal body L-ring protein [Micavibrio sp.]|tara:strand:+ start:1626 stop:2375 length:750 start_codon:yes stop_codon:yes gene_type:complete
MKKQNMTKMISVLALISLSACSAADRLANVGSAPEMEPIRNPAEHSQVQKVSMPMPNSKEIKPHRNSLWGGDRQTFFKDQRAGEVGDILTVMIDIQDEAVLDNETDRSRTSTENAALNSLLGLEADLGAILPEAVVNTDLVDADADSNYRGQGSVEREEEIQIQLAAVVTQVLPNGNLVIQGRQEVRVNFEKRVLELAGVIRPEDVSIDNTISHEKIAEARISYGGKGQITDMQQPRYGQQVFDILFPF